MEQDGLGNFDLREGEGQVRVGRRAPLGQMDRVAVGLLPKLLLVRFHRSLRIRVQIVLVKLRVILEVEGVDFVL